MAHVIDFTLFYGGVASAPVAELPFAGSSFDVQEGTVRRAFLVGVPEVESVAFVDVGAVEKTAPGVGTCALSYAALWEDAGGVFRTAGIGAVGLSCGVDVGDLTAGAKEAALGAVVLFTAARADLSAVPSRAPNIGKLAAEIAIAVTLEGFQRESSCGEPGWQTSATVGMDAVVRPSAVAGEAVLVPAHTVDAAALSSAAAFGLLDVGFDIGIALSSLPARMRGVGTPEYAWRKCPRWDVVARVRRDRHMKAEIRPAPKMKQAWNGEGRIRMWEHVHGMVVREVESYVVAQKREAMQAAIRREEQA